MKKYILMLSLVLVLALVVIGVGYGYWSETLDVNGTVSTGNVSMQWTTGTQFCYEYHLSGGMTGSKLMGEPAGANAASYSLGDDDGDNLLTLTLSNAYPGYGVHCDLPFKNDGTLPIIGRSVKVNYDSNFTNCTNTSSSLGEDIEQCDQMKLSYLDNYGTPFAPGGGSADQIDVFIIGDNVDFSSSQTYEFYMGSCVVQNVGLGGIDPLTDIPNCVYPTPPFTPPSTP